MSGKPLYIHVAVGTSGTRRDGVESGDELHVFGQDL